MNTDELKDVAEPSPASAGSVAERPLGDPEIAVEILKLRVAELEQAIRRLAEQDATLSVQGENVIVEMDATPTLTDAEREAVDTAAEKLATPTPTWQQNVVSTDAEGVRLASILRGLLERLG